MAIAGKIKAGHVVYGLSADDKKLKQGLRDAEGAVKHFGDKVKKIGLSISAATAPAIAAMTAATVHFASMGAHSARVAKRLGTSVENLTALQFAAKQTGTEVDALNENLQEMELRMSTAANTGSGALYDAFQLMGLSAKRLKQEDPAKAFTKIAAAISKLPTKADKNFAIDSIFGGQGREMINLINQGADGINKLTAQAKAMGVVMTKQDAKNAIKLSKALELVSSTVSQLANNIGSALAPILTAIIGKAATVIAVFAKLIRANSTVAATVGIVVAGVGALGVALTSLGLVLPIAATAVTGLNTAFAFLLANPIILTIAGIAAAITAIGIAANYATSYTAKLSDAMSKQLTAGDKQRANDLARLKQLKRLNDIQFKTAAQQQEAQNIIKKLTDRYGDLGLSVDKTTGKINGLSKAQKKLNAQMSKAAKQQLQAQISEQKANIKQLETKLHNNTHNFFQNAIAGGSELLGFGDPSVNINNRIRAAQNKLNKTLARLKALNSGDKNAITGSTTNNKNSLGGLTISQTQQLNQKRADLAQKIATLRIKLSKKGLAQQIALIDQKYDHEEKRARQTYGANAKALIAQMETARSREKQLAKQNAKSGAGGQADLTRRQKIAELQIKTNLSGKKQQEALLSLHKKEAIAKAKANGQSIALVKKEFKLRKQLLEQQNAGLDKAQATARGSFATAALAQRFGATFVRKDTTQEKTEGNTADTAKFVERIYKWLENEGGGAFT